MLKAFKSRAFRRGFAAGMSAPYRFLLGPKPRYQKQPQNLVAQSWHQVGAAMRSAMTDAGALDVKASRHPRNHAH